MIYQLCQPSDEWDHFWKGAPVVQLPLLLGRLMIIPMEYIMRQLWHEAFTALAELKHTRATLDTLEEVRRDELIGRAREQAKAMRGCASLSSARRRQQLIQSCLQRMETVME